MGAAPGWVAAGPGAITFLFVGISVELMEARQRAAKPEAWAAYVREVPSALLLLPPPLNQAIGRWRYGGKHSTVSPHEMK